MEPDALLRRLERTAIGLCGAMACAAFVVPHGSWRLAAAVVGGGLLAAVSYASIKSTVSSVIARASGVEQGTAGVPRWQIAVHAVGRYALLALLAYVMIARLRLHPLGLLAGASSIVAAVTVEAVRVLVKKS